MAAWLTYRPTHLTRNPARAAVSRNNGPEMIKPASNERLARYQSASTLPLLLASFLYIAALIVSLVDPEPFTSYVFIFTYLVFICDYAIQVWLAPVKWRYVARHLPYLFALIFPPLRMYLLLVISYRLFINKNSSLRDRIGLAAGFAVVVIVVFGALLTWLFEAQDPQANIKTYGEALWWAAVTVTTVGYGDFVPVTVSGRITGTLVFSTGVAAIAVLTATMIGWFNENAKGQRKRKPKQHPSKQEEIVDLLSKLDEINTRLINLEGGGGAGAASRKLSVPRRTVVATTEHESHKARSSPSGTPKAPKAPGSEGTKPATDDETDRKNDADSSR